MNQLLVVDDDNSIREMLSTFLTLEGFAVRQARSGDEGLEYFRNRGPFACVISDFQMYGAVIKNGVLMLKEIRTEAPNQKCILQSASWNLGKLLSVNGLGDIPILQKPFHLKDLMEELRKLGVASVQSV